MLKILTEWWLSGVRLLQSRPRFDSRSLQPTTLRKLSPCSCAALVVSLSIEIWLLLQQTLWGVARALCQVFNLPYESAHMFGTSAY